MGQAAQATAVGSRAQLGARAAEAPVTAPGLNALAPSGAALVVFCRQEDREDRVDRVAARAITQNPLNPHIGTTLQDSTLTQHSLFRQAAAMNSETFLSLNLVDDETFSHWYPIAIKGCTCHELESSQQETWRGGGSGGRGPVNRGCALRAATSLRTAEGGL